MNRKLLLISNSGTPSNFLPGVSKDIAEYNTFFQSDEGGAWMSTEIMREESLTVEKFCNVLKSLTDIDYLMIVFCGHGYTNTHGVRYLELSENEDISIFDIRALVRCRLTLITDCCASVFVPRLQMITESLRTFSYGGKLLRRRVQCREAYNKAIMSLPENNYFYAHACSLGESAGEDEDGGYFSQELLKWSNHFVKEFADKSIFVGVVIPFSSIFHLASQDTMVKTGYKQRPVRSTGDIPFVVY